MIMDSLQKLNAVSSAASVEDPEEGRKISGPLTCDNLPIYNAVVSGGKNIRLLKSLLTSVCENNCAYCGIRWAKDSRRVTFTPDEMADLFLELHGVGACEGLFLSSGISGGGIRTQDKLIATAEIVRRKGFQGYLHLKIMPGAERDQVERAMRFSNRVSINLEAPTAECLAAIAPKKHADALFEPLRWIEEIRASTDPRETWNGRWPSSSTQFVVGAAGESDRDLLGVCAARREWRAFTIQLSVRQKGPRSRKPRRKIPSAVSVSTRRIFSSGIMVSARRNSCRGANACP
jgi:predicted DNA-binding helix-hairpin-helix protein